MIQLRDPETQELLSLSEDGESLESKKSNKKFIARQHVFSFLPVQDDFYEGAYLNRIKFIPRSESLLSILPLWLINNGYLWEVRKQFKPGSILVELGCASGVDYFGSRYQMIGLDLSFASLTGLQNYKYALQADATHLPIADKSVDGIISSYFWEHIPPPVKDTMLIEFKRVLKPGGTLVFLYDVETDNSFIRLLKKDDPKKYKELFLDKDGHVGYETPDENRQRFIEHGFTVKKHFGMERTWFQSHSVYEKFSYLNGWKGRIGKIGRIVGRYRILNLINTFFVRVTDQTAGRLFNEKKSRIIISVIQNKT
jgi:SAM-dependent methyltransferase